MKSIAAIFITLFLTMNLFSQDSTSIANEDVQKNSLYAEALGMGIIYSVNYERVFPIAKRFYVGTRIGISAHFIVTPILEINFLIGGPHHFFDCGVGVEFTELITNSGTPSPGLHLGYRYQGKNGLFLRVSPLLMSEINSDPNTPQKHFNYYYAGISVGYCF